MDFSNVSVFDLLMTPVDNLIETRKKMESYYNFLLKKEKEKSRIEVALKFIDYAIVNKDKM